MKHISELAHNLEAFRTKVKARRTRPNEARHAERDGGS